MSPLLVHELGPGFCNLLPVTESKSCLAHGLFFSSVYDPILFILTGNEDMHKNLDEY